MDICNGMNLTGTYAYVTTFFHPYIMGCYGKGSSIHLYQGCSSNPRLCGVQMAIAKNSINLSALSSLAVSFLLLFEFY